MVELKIVNEVGSQCSPHLELRSNRPTTPPSLDIVDEELAKVQYDHMNLRVNKNYML